jgi:hypothetical protein
MLSLAITAYGRRCDSSSSGISGPQHRNDIPIGQGHVTSANAPVPPAIPDRHPTTSTPARDQWMLCMNQALDEQPMDNEVREAVRQAFAGLADHMRNQS